MAVFLAVLIVVTVYFCLAKVLVFVKASSLVSSKCMLNMLLFIVVLCSCGDDGRIRGWKWKDISDFEVQGNMVIK